MEDIHSGPATNTNPIVFFDIALGGELPVLDLLSQPIPDCGRVITYSSHCPLWTCLLAYLDYLGPGSRFLSIMTPLLTFSRNRRAARSH